MSSEDKFKGYHYVLAEFKNELDANGKKLIDILPFLWVNIDGKDATTFYPPPPYNNVEELVKKAEGFELNWEQYPIFIKGFAKTYTEATKKLRILKKTDHVLSSCSDTDSNDRNAHANKNVAQKRVVSLTDGLLEFGESDDDVPLEDLRANGNGTKYISVKSREEITKTGSTKRFIKEASLELTKCLTDEGTIISQGTVECILRSVDVLIQYHLTDLKEELKELKEKTRSAESFNEIPKNVVINIETLKNKWGLDIPANTHEEFSLLDSRFGNTDFRNDFENALQSVFDTQDSITKNVTRIMRAVVTKELAMQFTAKKKNDGKEVFSLTNMSLAIEAFIGKKMANSQSSCTKKMYEKAVSTVLPNAKDWDGGRAKRK